MTCHPERSRGTLRLGSSPAFRFGNRCKILCSTSHSDRLVITHTLCHPNQVEGFCVFLTMREYHFYVYILQSASRRALYIGVTNNLRHRVFQHKTHQFEGFTDDYNAVRLVYWEKFVSVGNAIAREKQLKRWRREKKIWLIERMNPEWRDLAADWYGAQGLSTTPPVRTADGQLRSR